MRSSKTPRRFILTLIAASACAHAQYKSEAAGAPPAELAPPIAQALQTAGTRIINSSGAVYSEVWFRTSAPSGPKSTEADVTLPTIPHGSLIGAIKFPAQGADRRGQTIKPGVYTLRFSLQPVTGDHVGASPQRDFLVMVPAADDKDPAATPAFDALMAMSRKASGTPHPAVLSVWSSTASSFPSFGKEGDHDWALNTKVGDLPLAVILIGKAE